MPNWCFSDIMIHGSKNEIELLHDKIKEFTSHNADENDFGLNWLGNIVLNAGFTTTDNDGNGFKCRGSMTTCQIENEEHLHIQTETAWGPTSKMWLALIEKYAPNCKFHLLAEEPGCELYVKYEDETDNVKYYDDIDYNVEVYMEYPEPNLSETEMRFLSNFMDEHEYATKELLDIINSYLKATKQKEINESDIESFFIDYDNRLENEDNYIIINKYYNLTKEELKEE
jgi:hypothetical protein